MRTRHRFRPSESWSLEDRIALSSTPVAAEVASAATAARNLRITFNGNFVTVPPAGIGGSETMSLGGQATIPRAGVVRLAGQLKSNGSVAPPFQGTSGALIVTSPKQPGSAILVVNGPVSDLSPVRRSVTPLTFRVVRATGSFASVLGQHGAGTLILRSRPVGAPGGIVSGRFTIKVTQA